MLIARDFLPVVQKSVLSLYFPPYLQPQEASWSPNLSLTGTLAGEDISSWPLSSVVSETAGFNLRVEEW